MKTNKVYSLLGLAERGRNVASGEFSVEKAVKEGRAFLVIVATDASNNTKKKFQNMTDFYKVTYYMYGTKEEIGHSIGKEFRATVAVTNEGLAKELIKNLT